MSVNSDRVTAVLFSVIYAVIVLYFVALFSYDAGYYDGRDAGEKVRTVEFDKQARELRQCLNGATERD